MAAVHDDGALPLSQHRLSLELRTHPVRGRGVFTTEFLPRNTLVEISPILLFPHDEYDAHGKYTALDHYTYRWKDGYALALGLGSMFNHSNKANVGFVRDFTNRVIRYMTLQDIEAGTELCISYGSNIWFDNEEDTLDNNTKQDVKDASDDGDDKMPWWQQIAMDQDENDE